MIDEITDRPNVTIDETRGLIFHARFEFSRCAFSFGIAPGGGTQPSLNADARTSADEHRGRTECDERAKGNLETDGRTGALTTIDDDGCAGP